MVPAGHHPDEQRGPVRQEAKSRRAAEKHGSRPDDDHPPAEPGISGTSWGMGAGAATFAGGFLMMMAETQPATAFSPGYGVSLLGAIVFLVSFLAVMWMT
jgi:hypothetical protein